MARLSGLVLLVAGALAGKSVEEEDVGMFPHSLLPLTTGFCHMCSLEDP